MDETKLAMHLPALDIEIVRRELPEEGVEIVTIHCRAAPSFESVADWLLQPGALPFALMAAGPLSLWAALLQAAWQPWLELASLYGPRLPKRD